MWNIVICSSNEVLAGGLKESLESFYREKEMPVRIRIYPDGSSFMEAIAEPLDLLLLDTRLSDRTGFETAKLIGARKPETRIIFMSEHDEDIFEASRYQPFRYIRLRNWKAELGEALTGLWAVQHKGRCIRIRQRQTYMMIWIDSIMYLESMGHYVHIHCTDHLYQTREKLAVFHKILEEQYFIHPTKSYLVNCSYIKIFDKMVQLTNGEQINCSKSRRNEAKRLYERYVREMTQGILS